MLKYSAMNALGERKASGINYRHYNLRTPESTIKSPDLKKVDASAADFRPDSEKKELSRWRKTLLTAMAGMNLLTACAGPTAMHKNETLAPSPVNNSTAIENVEKKAETQKAEAAEELEQKRLAAEEAEFADFNVHGHFRKIKADHFNRDVLWKGKAGKFMDEELEKVRDDSLSVDEQVAKYDKVRAKYAVKNIKARYSIAKKRTVDCYKRLNTFINYCKFQEQQGDNSYSSRGYATKSAQKRIKRMFLNMKKEIKKDYQKTMEAYEKSKDDKLLVDFYSRSNDLLLSFPHGVLKTIIRCTNPGG